MHTHDKEYYKVGYKLLTKKNPKFPAHFTKEMKNKMYITFMEHFKAEENFEYCSTLSQSLNQINNETNN